MSVVSESVSISTGVQRPLAIYMRRREPRQLHLPSTYSHACLDIEQRAEADDVVDVEETVNILSMICVQPHDWTTSMPSNGH